MGTVGAEEQIALAVDRPQQIGELGRAARSARRRAGWRRGQEGGGLVHTLKSVFMVASCPWLRAARFSGGRKLLSGMASRRRLHTLAGSKISRRLGRGRQILSPLAGARARPVPARCVCAVGPVSRAGESGKGGRPTLPLCHCVCLVPLAIGPG